MSSIKKYILGQVGRQAMSQEEAKKLLTELASSSQARVDDIAIVGMAGRFPMANNPEQFWQLLRDGINCIREFPEARRKDFEHILKNPNYTEFLIGAPIPPSDVPFAHARAGYLEEIDKFDAAFFGIPPAEAAFMDPQQKLALELAWETMEDAGYGGRRLYGTNTGIFIGKEGTNHSLYRYTSIASPMKLTGSWESILASRISYLFNFRGPCMVLDTACSSGLVSIHMAAQAIMNGDCDQAIAGGMNASITGEFDPRYQGPMAMDAVQSKDGVVRTFDARANGTVWGEGIALVMLKSLTRAVADRDHIHAIIKGSAINNDGASNGLTAPNAEAQEQVIVKAWQKARIDPSTLSYVEAHGTGTVLGDPIEFKGLSEAFRRFTNKRQFCAIGSLKPNMGHLVGASGVASLFKVVKSLQHKEMAPTIHFGQPNPFINFLSSPLYVNDTVRPWRQGATARRAALSSFGFSHTNCHMVVEEAPPKQALPRTKAVYCFSLAAHTKAVLQDYVERFCAFAVGDHWDLADVCYTSNLGRGHYPHRLAILAATEAQLRERLATSVAAINGGLPGEAVQYRYHEIVSEKKKQLEAHEITDRQKKSLSDSAALALEKFLASQGKDLSSLHEIARLYVAGADVNWEKFYLDEARYQVSLPTYPLQRIRVWAEPKVSKIASFDNRLHPLVEHLVSRSETETIFESRFCAASHWVLSDHKIKGTCVVPGTTYLEMARVAARESQGWTQLELCDVFFLVPMVVEEGESRRVRIRLSQVNALLEFEIDSCAEANDAEWVRHVEGRIQPCSGPARAALDIDALKAGAHEAIENYQGESDTGVFQFGPHWDATRAAWRIGDDVLARLALPAALQHELAVFELHPSVLDNAVNLTSQSSGSTYLPFTYKSLKLFAPFTRDMYSLILPKLNKLSSETMSFDVILTDQDGVVLGEITDYVAKKVSSFVFGAPRAGADGEYLCARWVAQPKATQDRLSNAHLLLIARGEPAQYDALARGFEAEGIQISRVSLVADLPSGPAQPGRAPTLLADDIGLARFVASAKFDGVAGLIFAADWGDEMPDYLASECAFGARRHLGVDALFRLTKALLNEKTKLPWGLCVLTQQAFRVDGNEKAIDPLGAASAALGCVVGMEYKNLPCRLVDAPSAAEGRALARHILAAPVRLQTALRSGGAFARELFPLRLPEKEAPPLRVDGVYLITGGLGGLGLATARHLAALGKVKVVLMGRSAIAARSEWPALAGQDTALAEKYAALLELSGTLGMLDYVACDVGDAAALDAALTKIRGALGPLCGVFHLAGVAGDGFLLRKEFSQFDAVLKPKLDGLRNLYAATAKDALDHMVLFSSITALTGGEGQGDYAAANAFMDALAWQAVQDGRKLISLNWPSWKEVGMAANYQVNDDNSPFAALAPNDAFARLTRVLAHGLTQVLPSTINPAAIAPLQDALPFVLAPELQRRLSSHTGARPNGKQTMADISVSIRGKSEEELVDTEIILAKVYGAVLGLAEVDVFTNFQDMGGNSIIATHLLKLIDSQFPDLVDISDVFSYSSIDEMAAYIDGKRARSGLVAAADTPTDWAHMIERVVDEGASIDTILAGMKHE